MLATFHFINAEYFYLAFELSASGHYSHVHKAWETIQLKTIMEKEKRENTVSSKSVL